MSWSNLQSWFAGSSRDREFNETRALWEQVEAAWRSSPFARGEGVFDITVEVVRELLDELPQWPATPICVALCELTEHLLRAEAVSAMEPQWSLIATDVAVAVNFRAVLARRRRWVADFPTMRAIFKRRLRDGFSALISALPEMCFEDWGDTEGLFGVPLIDLLHRPAETVHALMVAPYDDDTMQFDLFLGLRERYVANLLVASGFLPSDNIHERQARLVLPTQRRGADSPSELAELYLGGTAWKHPLDLNVPFSVPAELRFEHCHIVGGTGHGKTQLIQRMIHADLLAAQQGVLSVVVIDSQGDLINKLVRLALFSPDEPDNLADRLVLIDPADVEFPAALNLFDAHLTRLRDYRPVDQERVLNGVIELYEMFFGALLGAELTQKQGVIFKYLARLMIAIEGSTIHTLMALMEDGKPFKKEMQRLDGSARHFFEKEFFDPSFAATKKQIIKRLWGVLSTPAFERMFAQRENKLDLFEAMNQGKVILVSTAKDLLKQEGSQLFGRFFIALIAQAALERSTLSEDQRTPTMVYVDEAQEYFDDNIETILTQARKYRVGLTLAHQTLDQLSPRLRSAILANTSVKCVGGVSAKDARALADELRTTPAFIEGMRRRKDHTEFAVWLKHFTPAAIRLSAPLGFLESQPLCTEEALESLIASNRKRYCGTYADVQEAMRTARARAEEAETPPIDPAPSPPSKPRPSVEPNSMPEEAEIFAPRERVPAIAPKPKPSEPKDLGKGGSQHRYLQHLIKGMAEERGFRVVIEEPVAGGQVDVALHRDDLSIACEISVTSQAEYEAKNLSKCVHAGFVRVWSISTDAKRRKAVEDATKRRLSEEEMGSIEFLTTEDIVAALDAFAAPETTEPVVRGYKVKVSRTIVSASETRERRAEIARVLAKSMRRMDDPP